MEREEGAKAKVAFPLFLTMSLNIFHCTLGTQVIKTSKND